MIKKSISFNKNTLLDFLVVLLGIFITMPILTITVAGRQLSIFTILLTIFMSYLVVTSLMRQTKNGIGRNCLLIVFWLVSAIVSSLFGLAYFDGMTQWTNAIASYIPKVIIYLVLALLISIHKKNEAMIHCFFVGFLIGCLLNIGWSVVEGVTYYASGTVLNNIVFAEYMKGLPQDRQFISIVMNDNIRTSGFNYDPAHLGGIIPITLFYGLLKRNIIVITLSIISLAFSQSTTALVATLLMIVLNMKKVVVLRRSSKLNMRILLTFLVSVVAIALYFTQEEGGPIYSIQKNAAGFLSRISTVYLKGGGDDPRSLYHFYLPAAALYAGLKLFTGIGFGVASYVYVLNPEVRKALYFGMGSVFPYDPESTYISYLFDLGVFGFTIYLYILFRIYRFFSKYYSTGYNGLIFASIGGVIFSGFFYHYTMTAYQVFVIIMAITIMDLKQRELK